MRWVLFAAVAVCGCQVSPAPVPVEPVSLGGGMVPSSYVARRSEPGDGPARLTSPPPLHIQRTSHVTRSWPAAEPVQMGHAADYRWVVGVLVQEGGTWHVRYGSQGNVDRYGGSMELLDIGPTDGFWSGQMVRVEGELVDPVPYEIRPAYRVRSLNVVSR